MLPGLWPGSIRHATSWGCPARFLLAARKGDELVYVGSVGTGFTHASGTELRRQMDKLIVPKAPLSMPVRKRGHRCIKPELIAEFALRGWTDDGKL